MKNRLHPLCLVVWTVASFAAADVVSFQPTPADLYDLDHGYYYTWCIRPDAEVAEIVVTGATLFFEDIRNWDNSPNDLWIHLLDTALSGVRRYGDASGGGDAFAGQGVLLEHYRNLPSRAQDITYIFSNEEVLALNLYLQNGDDFALGFDPDCHFYNNGITLVLEYTSVPEPASAGLLAAALPLLRRRRKVEKR